MKKTAGRSLNFGEFEQLQHEQLANYDGDSYIVDQLVDAGYDHERAEADVQDPEFLKFCLEHDGIKEILADRLACLGLKKALLDGRRDVIEKLIAEVQWLRVARKRGPVGKMKDGKYLYQQVVELRNQGLSWGKIALQLWGDSSLASRAKAHYNQAKKKGHELPRQ
jgi:hypothetical protein